MLSMAARLCNDLPSALSISCFCSTFYCNPAGLNLSIGSSYAATTIHPCSNLPSTPSASS